MTEATSEAGSGAEPEASEPADVQVDAGDAGAGDDQGASALRHEAARWRTQLRDVEAERDQLRDRVQAMQRVEVARVAGASGMAVPPDLWLLVSDLGELLSDAGDVDANLVRERVQAILRERPSWRQPDLAVGGTRVGNGPASRRELFDLLEQHRSG
jgi:hypothetical protein